MERSQKKTEAIIKGLPLEQIRDNLSFQVNDGKGLSSLNKIRISYIINK
jgi:hypothetical protein